MKEKNNQTYQTISSFSDFRAEKKRLKLKKKLIEARLQFHVCELKEEVSSARLLRFDLVEESIQKFSGLFERIFRSGNKTTMNEPGAETKE